MFTGGGTVVARYDYDPYGRSTTVLGTTPTDFNFTGLYHHSKSNLDLAVYRAYDPYLGGWLNRDSLKYAELKEGTNLFAYVRNTPINLTDPSGKGVWTYFKCSHIRNKWYRDCFSKLPDCNTACGATAQDKIETIAICMQDWQNRAQSRGNNGPGGFGGLIIIPDQEEERRPVVYRVGSLPKELPAWFTELDTDKDGQVGLYEWKAAGRPLADFQAMDRNGDGFLTVEEALLYQKAQAKAGGNGKPSGGPVASRPQVPVSTGADAFGSPDLEGEEGF